MGKITILKSPPKDHPVFKEWTCSVVRLPKQEKTKGKDNRGYPLKQHSQPQ